MGPGPSTTAAPAATTATPPPPHHQEALPPDAQDRWINEEEHSAAGEEPKKDESAYRTSDLSHKCVRNVCRAFHALCALFLYVFPAPSSRVQSVLHVPRAVPLYVTGDCLHVRAFCTPAEPDCAVEGVWDADKDSATDLDMYTQFS